MCEIEFIYENLNRILKDLRDEETLLCENPDVNSVNLSRAIDDLEYVIEDLKGLIPETLYDELKEEELDKLRKLTLPKLEMVSRIMLKS